MPGAVLSSSAADDGVVQADVGGQPEFAHVDGQQPA